MHLIDGPGATDDHRFVLEDRQRGIAKTLATVAWLNAIQEEPSAVIESAGLTLDKTDNTQLSQAIAILSGLRSTGRNLLANGDFRFWQRDNATVGTFVAVTSAAGRKYTTDRWAATADGSTSGAGQSTLSRQAFTVGQTEVPGEPTYYLRFSQASASTLGNPRLDQRVEDVRRTAGQTLTLSGSIRAAAAVPVDVTLVQDFGTGGSADNVIAPQTVDIGTSFGAFELTFTVPGISGATVGDGSFLEVRFTLPAGVGFTLDMADLQLERGSSATPFERRSDWIELLRVQRYYETSWGYQTSIGSNLQEGSIAGVSNGETWTDAYQAIRRRFRVEKRTAPTMLWYSLSGATNKITLAGLASFLGTDNPEFSVSSSVNASPVDTGWPRSAAIPSSGSGWKVACAHWTADAEL